MKLRSFLYLDTKIIEDYLAAIDGYSYDEESQAIATSSEKMVGGKIGANILSGSGAHSGRQEEEVKRSVKISDAAKFDKIYKYLQSINEEGSRLKYYEFLNEDDYEKLGRDDYIEVLVTARFSKMKELADSTKGIEELVTMYQEKTNQQIIDKEKADAINAFSALSKLQSGKIISCIFNFDNGKYPIIAHLDESFFLCQQDRFVVQAYMLCKIVRKIPKGESVKIDEVFERIKKLSLSREQRRQMPKNIDNPDIVRDVIRGPALIVLAIAVYQ